MGIIGIRTINKGEEMTIYMKPKRKYTVSIKPWKLYIYRYKALLVHMELRRAQQPPGPFFVCQVEFFSPLVALRNLIR